MEDSSFSPPQKNKTGEIECQNNADLFLRHSRNCAQGIRSQGSDGQPGDLPGVLKRLRERVRRTRPELWRSGEWLIHHDKSPAHTAFRIRQFLTSQGMTLVPHPPYSPDLAPAAFFFPRMKRDFKGRRFDTVEDIIAASTRALNSIQVEEFHRCFEQSKQRLDKCISSNGEYLEGD